MSTRVEGGPVATSSNKRFSLTMLPGQGFLVIDDKAFEEKAIQDIKTNKENPYYKKCKQLGYISREAIQATIESMKTDPNIKNKLLSSEIDARIEENLRTKLEVQYFLFSGKFKPNDPKHKKIIQSTTGDTIILSNIRILNHYGSAFHAFLLEIPNHSKVADFHIFRKGEDGSIEELRHSGVTIDLNSLNGFAADYTDPHRVDFEKDKDSHTDSNKVIVPDIKTVSESFDSSDLVTLEKIKARVKIKREQYASTLQELDRRAKVAARRREYVKAGFMGIGLFSVLLAYKAALPFVVATAIFSGPSMVAGWFMGDSFARTFKNTDFVKSFLTIICCRKNDNSMDLEARFGNYEMFVVDEWDENHHFESFIGKGRNKDGSYSGVRENFSGMILVKETKVRNDLAGREVRYKNFIYEKGKQTLYSGLTINPARLPLWAREFLLESRRIEKKPSEQDLTLNLNGRKGNQGDATENKTDDVLLNINRDAKDFAEGLNTHVIKPPRPKQVERGMMSLTAYEAKLEESESQAEDRVNFFRTIELLQIQSLEASEENAAEVGKFVGGSCFAVGTVLNLFFNYFSDLILTIPTIIYVGYSGGGEVGAAISDKGGYKEVLKNGLIISCKVILCPIICPVTYGYRFLKWGCNKLASCCGRKNKQQASSNEVTTVVLELPKKEASTDTRTLKPTRTGGSTLAVPPGVILEPSPRGRKPSVDGRGAGFTPLLQAQTQSQSPQSQDLKAGQDSGPGEKRLPQDPGSTNSSSSGEQPQASGKGKPGSSKPNTGAQNGASKNGKKSRRGNGN